MIALFITLIAISAQAGARPGTSRALQAGERPERGRRSRRERPQPGRGRAAGRGRRPVEKGSRISSSGIGSGGSTSARGSRGLARSGRTRGSGPGYRARGERFPGSPAWARAPGDRHLRSAPAAPVTSSTTGTMSSTGGSSRTGGSTTGGMSILSLHKGPIGVEMHRSTGRGDHSSRSGPSHHPHGASTPNSAHEQRGDTRSIVVSSRGPRHSLRTSRTSATRASASSSTGTPWRGPSVEPLRRG